METQNNMTLKQAIKHTKEVANSKCGECANEHQQLAEWLTELQSYKDETPITPKYLCFNKFEYKGKSDNYFYVDTPRFEIILKEYRSKYEKNENGEFAIIDKDRITITCIDKDIDENKCTYELRVRSNGRDYFDGWIKTVGQLRMFLSLCGLGDFANQLK